MTNKEYIIFIKFIFKDHNLLITIKHIIKKILKILRKFINMNYYPITFKKISIKDCIDINKDCIDINKEGIVNQVDFNDLNLCIKLATQTYIINNPTDLHREFSDSEDYESIHRFIWLRRFFSQNKIQKDEVLKIEKIIKYWFYNYKRDKRFNNRLIKQSYTASERVVNIIYFFIRTGINMPIYIRKHLDETVILISDNLEFYEQGYGNHLINNFRAIICYSLYCKNNKILDQIIPEFEKYLNNFIDHGYTKDCSTHYHLLVCFWLYDMKYFNNIHPIDKLETLLTNYFKILSEKAKSLYNNKGDTFPLLGDISPDYTPAYLTTMIVDKEFKANDVSIHNLYK